MTTISLVRDSTETISQSITQHGNELFALNKLFSVAEKVAQLSPTQIKLHRQTLGFMLTTTQNEIKTLNTNLSKIKDDLGKVVTPLSVGDNENRDKAHAKTLRQLKTLIPPIHAAGNRAAQLIEKIKIVQRKITGDSVPTASNRCSSLFSKQTAIRGLYVLATLAAVAIGVGTVTKN